MSTHEDSLPVAATATHTVGVGPHPLPWPEGEHYDPELLANGDRRNVLDRYRYWRREAIVADLDLFRHPLDVAIENFEHDFNIGSVVRSANAFGVGHVHIVGRRRWNRRGAMVTDRYQHVLHHPTSADLAAWAKENGKRIVAVDNTPGAIPIEHAELPRDCLMVFGQEGPGVSPETLAVAELVTGISQFGSTRSINVGAAAAVAMHTWIMRHADIPRTLASPGGPGPAGGPAFP
ncbi:TrmH family RNA methyltransferase [Dermabacteraceae bacterium P7006]